VLGFQGEHGPGSILAGPKHLAGYGSAHGGHDYDDAEISELELHNVYLRPFQAAIGAGAGNIVSAYMDVNDVPAKQDASAG
jgi:beta-glucosidase